MVKWLCLLDNCNISAKVSNFDNCLSHRKQNASERINLQDIMQLRTAFLTADDSGDGELSLKEVSIR